MTVKPLLLSSSCIIKQDTQDAAMFSSDQSHPGDTCMRFRVSSDLEICRYHAPGMRATSPATKYVGAEPPTMAWDASMRPQTLRHQQTTLLELAKASRNASAASERQVQMRTVLQHKIALKMKAASQNLTTQPTQG